MGFPSGLESDRVIRVQRQADAADSGNVGKIRGHAHRGWNERGSEVAVVAGGEVTRNTGNGANFRNEVLFIQLGVGDEVLRCAVAARDDIAQAIIDGVVKLLSTLEEPKKEKKAIANK